MPFNFSEFAQWCQSWSDEDIQKEYQRCVKQVVSGTAAEAVAFGFARMTKGLSIVTGTPSALRDFNAAAMKVRITRGEIKRRESTLKTRSGDVLRGMAMGGIGLLSAPLEHVVFAAVPLAALPALF